MEPEEFPFKLDMDDYRTIMEALMEMPFKKVNTTINKLHTQMTTTMDKKEKPAK